MHMLCFINISNTVYQTLYYQQSYWRIFMSSFFTQSQALYIMLGYCSNSPLRCEKARTMEVLNQVDSCCPDCKLFLIPAQDISQQLRAIEQFLRLLILIVVCILLVSIYVYYSTFLQLFMFRSNRPDSMAISHIVMMSYKSRIGWNCLVI